MPEKLHVGVVGGGVAVQRQRQGGAAGGAARHALALEHQPQRLEGLGIREVDVAAFGGDRGGAYLRPGRR